MTPRSESTQAKFRQAFEGLLEEKPYDVITMEDIAKRAGRTRATIYRHYADKETLLLDSLEHVVEELKEQVIYPSAPKKRQISLAAYTNLTVLFTHAAQHRAFYRALLICSASSKLRVRFRRILVGILIHVLTVEGTIDQIPAPTDIVCNVLAEMFLGGLIWWLETDAHDPEVIAEVMMRLSETGIFGLTGQKPIPPDISCTPFSPHQRPRKFLLD